LVELCRGVASAEEWEINRRCRVSLIINRLLLGEVMSSIDWGAIC
jgi:hypothetical protein